MPEPRRHRWYGEAGTEQPDVGDILYYAEDDRPDWFRLVHGASPVRGRGPEHLWLMVERLDFGPRGELPDAVTDALDGDTGRLIPARVLRRR